ncbi:MAG: ATP-binding cassette domain-containing protein [Flavobacteriales bacterium]|nr:ATP-binding cassette domain-containing protein [Flavobacteriales bacterium]
MDIRIDHLTKYYGSQAAVDDISFQVSAGEVLGFLGPNGAGKSTTMKMICGLIAPNKGTIAVGGKSVSDEPGEVRKMIGYLPESNPLYEDMPVLDLLRFAARVQGVPKDQQLLRIREMVDVCGLGDEKHKKVGELSKGYRQRVGLAQAMVHDPQVLILDEPTTGLDPNQIVEIRSLIKELGQAKTVIFSTHILPEVEAICDRILIINKGKIVADGAPSLLRAQAQGEFVLQLRVEDAARDTVLAGLGTLLEVASALPLGGSLDRYEVKGNQGTDPARAIFQLCVRNGWTLTEMRPLETRLEDIFRDLTLN